MQEKINLDAVGSFVVMYPEHLENLKAWARPENRWARRGLFLPDILEIADILLSDGDDLVRKGYGWMLKAAAEAHLQEVHGYVMKKRDRMPRTALRYAIEKMPAELKARTMAG